MDRPPVPVGNSRPFISSRRNFIVIGHRGTSDGSINLNDLCGASGRWDGLARCITSALFLSHAMRRDTAIHLVLLGPGDPPKVLTIEGSTVKYLNPDERASAALMRKNLGISIPSEMGRTYRVSPGIYITRGDLESVLSSVSGPIFLMDEKGVDARDFPGLQASVDENLNFLLSDDMEFSEDDHRMMDSFLEERLSVGPLSLHTYQTIVIVNNILDSMGR